MRLSCLASAREEYLHRAGFGPGTASTGDEAFLHELFLIFLDNAIKYSPDGTRIHVTLEIPGGVIQARFQDQGVGISPEHLPFIFDRSTGPRL